jgi:serine/threonine protein kinase
MSRKSFFGRHGDLKPENILWFPDQQSTGSHGILKITDFGITRFSSENNWNGRVPNSPSYRSPEYDLSKKLSTACDIWALGCVYIQFIVWYYGGHNYLQHFGDRRLAIDKHWWNYKTDTFFTTYEESGVEKAKVKDSVKQVSFICQYRRQN